MHSADTAYCHAKFITLHSFETAARRCAVLSKSGRWQIMALLSSTPGNKLVTSIRLYPSEGCAWHNA